MTVIYPSLSNWLPPFTSSQSLGWRTTEVFGPTSDLPRPFSALYSHRKTDGQNHKPTNVMLCGCSGATLPSGGTLAELLLIDVPLLGGASGNDATVKSGNNINVWKFNFMDGCYCLEREKTHRLGSCVCVFLLDCDTVCLSALVSFKTCIIFVNVQFIELKPNCCTSIIWVGVGCVVCERECGSVCVREGCEAPVPGRRAYWRRLNTRTMGSFDQNDTPKTCGLLSPWQPPMGQSRMTAGEEDLQKWSPFLSTEALPALYLFPSSPGPPLHFGPGQCRIHLILQLRVIDLTGFTCHLQILQREK